MNLPTNQGAYLLKSLLQQFGNATLVFYTGVMPPTPETALSGNTALVSFSLGDTAVYSVAASGGYMVATCQLKAGGVATPTANGVVTFARATFTVLTWGIGTHYFVGQVVSNSGNLYCCILDGVSQGTGGTGPTGTGGPGGVPGAGILDGAAAWAYIGPSSGTNNVFGDFTVGTSGADIIIANTSITTSVPVTITSLTIRTPAT